VPNDVGAASGRRSPGKGIGHSAFRASSSPRKVNAPAQGLGRRLGPSPIIPNRSASDQVGYLLAQRRDVRPEVSASEGQFPPWRSHWSG